MRCFSLPVCSFLSEWNSKWNFSQDPVSSVPGNFQIRSRDIRILLRLGAFLRTDHAGIRKLVHDTGGPVEADLEYTLQHSNGCLVLFDDEFPGIGKEFIHIASPLLGCRGYLLYFVRSVPRMSAL